MGDQMGDPVKVLTGAEILAAPATETALVRVKGWGAVRLRVMSALEAVEWQEWLAKQSEGTGGDRAVMQELLFRTLCSDAGERLFADDQHDDVIRRLGEKGFPTIAALFRVASRINRTSAAAVEELEGN